MDTTALAWAAGMFEGEGSIGLYATKGRGKAVADIPALQVTLTNCDADIVAVFQSLWPATVRTQEHVTHSSVHRWRITGDRAAAMLSDIRPYLRCARVRAKVTIALRCQASKGQPAQERMAYIDAMRSLGR